MERVMLFNLSRALRKPVSKRHRAAIRILKELGLRHGKGIDVKISPKVAERVKYQSVPKRIMVKLVNKENVVYILDPQESLEKREKE
ncbi:MAG: hypothetical protein NZ908_01685 [Candidatus Micrarchaeota archaeon]|nr:hypothetical protein [Candidatus Micrarchaeota archaeon]